MNSEHGQRSDGAPSVSVVVANFNGMDTLPAMLASIKRYPIELAEIIVVDDGSTDGSAPWLREHHPDVRVVAMPHNTGNLGRVRNAGILAARGTHVFLTDNDVTLLPGCLDELLAVLMSNPDVFCATPRLVYREDSDRIYQDGNGVHFLGLSTGSRRDMRVRQVGTPAPFPTCGGGIMMFDAERLATVGLFDERYLHGWGDDGELQLRGALLGFRCLHVPSAVATHCAKAHGNRRAASQIHNRHRLILTFYRTRTLLLLAPDLLLTEIGLMLASLAGGFAPEYLEAARATWRERKDIRRTRRALQQRRKVDDSALLRGGALQLPNTIESKPLLKPLIAGVRMLLDLDWLLVQFVDRQPAVPAPPRGLPRPTKS